jgi:tetratricopeptide (TPR) repeat protein
MGNYEEALADYEQSLIYRPDNQWTLFDRMLTYIALEDFDGATTDYAAWIDLIQSEQFAQTLMSVGETREIEMNEGWVVAIPFNAFAGEPLTVRVESSVGGPVVDPLIVVLDMDGAPIALDDDGGGGLAAQIAELNVPIDCEYTLIVTHAGAGSVGTVTVSITSAAVDV